jgi:hypothetical protein
MVARTRPPPIGAARPQTGLPGAVPALTLALGLAVVAVVVASTPHLAPHALADEVAGQYGLYPVPTTPPIALPLPVIDPFSSVALQRSWWLTIGLTVVYLGSVTALGSAIVRAVRGDDRWPWAVSVVAGFLPGYLMLLAPLQLLFAALPWGTAAWIGLACPPIAALLLHRRAVSASVRGVRRARPERRRVGWMLLAVIGLVLAALAHRLQVDGSYLTQDSILWFLVAGNAQLQGSLGSYLVQWGQQSDEWVFNAPLMFTSHHLGDLWFPFYATQAVAVASFSALVVGIVHRVARRRKSLAAGVVVLVLFMMTPTIYPWIYVTVVVGGQPLWGLGHAGRFVGIIAPWIAVLVVGRQPRSVSIALAFAVLGLGFVSLNALIDVVAAVVAVVVWRIARGHGKGWLRIAALRGATHLVPAVGLGAFVCAFWWLHVGSVPDAAGWWLLLGTAVSLMGAVAVLLGTAGRPALAPVRPGWAGAWTAAVLTGVVLSNNLTESVFGGHVRSALASVLPGYDGVLLNRTGVSRGIFDNVSFPALSDQACQIFIACRGVADFLAALGVVLVVVLATWIAMGPLTPDRETNGRRYALLLLIAGLGVGLMAIFFSGGQPAGSNQHQADIFSRVLEFPYYGLLALAALTFAEARSRITAIAGTGVLVLWSVIPLVAARRPEEWVRNAGWLLRHTGIV